jgi:hypothetical protein
MTNDGNDLALQPFNASTLAKPYRAFSPGRIAAITLNTLTELTRLRVFYVLLVFALLLIGSSISMAQFSFQQEFQILKDVSLGAISIFTSLLAIVATARMLPQDIEDRTVYTILAKPVPRFEYVFGKIAGVLLLLAISTLAMGRHFCWCCMRANKLSSTPRWDKCPARRPNKSLMLFARSDLPRSTSISFPELSSFT